MATKSEHTIMHMRATKELADKLTELAKADGRTRINYIHWILKQHVEQNPSPKGKGL